ERNEPLFTTLPIVEISGTAATGPYTFPDFADGAGWTTQIVLINPADSQLTGTVQFLDASGNAITLTAEGQTSNTFNYQIPSRAAQRLRTSGTSSSVVSGSVRVVPGGNNISPAGVVVFSTRASGATVA